MMFISYLPETGEVTGTFVIDGDVRPIVKADEKLIKVDEGVTLPELFYIDEQERVVTIEPSSDPFHVFCHRQKKWIEDPSLPRVIKTYKEKRSEAYPEIGAQLDAAFKLAQYLQDIGHALPLDVQHWIEQCQQVKELYPAN